MRTKELNFVVWQSQPSLLAVTENQRLLTLAKKSRTYDDEIHVQSYMFINLLPTAKCPTLIRKIDYKLEREIEHKLVWEIERHGQIIHRTTAK